jgi:non-ribosomal peptide synthetase component F
MTKAADYWRSKLNGTTLHATRTDHLRSAGLPKGTAAHRFLLDAELTAEVMRLSRSLRSSPFMLMLAAYNVFLHRSTGQSDLTVTTLSSGRADARFQQTVGSFFNFVPLRTDLGPCRTFRDVVRATRSTCLEAYAHEMPFPQLVGTVPELMTSLGDDGAMVAFQVFQEPFMVDRQTVGDIEYRDVRRRLTSQDDTVDVPDGALWTLEIDPAGETLCSLMYNTNLFDHDTMAAMTEDYCRLLRRLITEPEAELSTHTTDQDTMIEQKVEEIWRSVLTVGPGQQDATFFELSGDSMSAVRITSRIQGELDVLIDVADIFEEDPTLDALVASVRERT